MILILITLLIVFIFLTQKLLKRAPTNNILYIK